MKHISVLVLLSRFSLFSYAHAAFSSVMSSQSQHPLLHAHAQTNAAKAIVKPRSKANGRKRRHSSASALNGVSGDYGGSIRKFAETTTTGSRSPQSSRNRRKGRRVEKTGLSNMCPPLDGPIGAPELPVLTTRDPRVIERWLEDNIGSDASEYTILGFDQESIAKTPWMPERESLPDGPATIQLSTPKSCIIVHLSRCGDGSAFYAPEVLRNVISNPRIIKVGVGIDDDALELYRWSKESFEDAQREVANDKQLQQGAISQLWEMKSRFDLGSILPNKNPGQRSGIRELAKKILGVDVIKSKSLSMSNWGNRHLTIEQISYAARDAWVSAAILERLQNHNDVVFGADALMEMESIKGQRSLDEMDQRARSRKVAKLLFKEILERQKNNEGATGDNEEERKQELNGLMKLYRPDQPPTFDEDAFTFTLF